MLVSQTSGLFSAGNAEYFGFGKLMAFLSGTTTPPAPPAGNDDANKIRVGIVRSGYVSDGNPSVGGQF